MLSQDEIPLGCTAWDAYNQFATNHASLELQNITFAVETLVLEKLSWTVI